MIPRKILVCFSLVSTFTAGCTNNMLRTQKKQKLSQNEQKVTTQNYGPPVVLSAKNQQIYRFNLNL